MLRLMVSSIHRKTRLLGAIFDRLEIDVEQAARLRGGAALAAASRTCLGCKSGDACERWLDQPNPNEGPPPFCPNSAFLAEACVRQASWPH